jgi:hypothetical protein
LEPFEDDGGIEAAGIGEHDFFDGFVHGGVLWGGLGCVEEGVLMGWVGFGCLCAAVRAGA